MANTTFTVQVISPEKQIFSGEVTFALIPGADGFFGVLPDHSSLVSELGVGVMELTTETEKLQLVIDAGFAEIKSNILKILTNGGDLKKNINLDKALKDLEIASASESKTKDYEIKKAKARIEIHKS
jgi:F-type H+-transporting ATPase subunit epsilon